MLKLTITNYLINIFCIGFFFSPPIVSVVRRRRFLPMKGVYRYAKSEKTAKKKHKYQFEFYIKIK